MLLSCTTHHLFFICGIAVPGKRSIKDHRATKPYEPHDLLYKVWDPLHGGSEDQEMAWQRETFPPVVCRGSWATGQKLGESKGKESLVFL